jgi:hypothetical protein
MRANATQQTRRSSARLPANAEHLTRGSIGKRSANITRPTPRKSGNVRAPIIEPTRRSNANATGRATSVSAIFCEPLGKLPNLESGDVSLDRHSGQPYPVPSPSLLAPWRE